METKILIRFVLLMILLLVLITAALFYVKPQGESLINYFFFLFKR